MPNTQCKVKVAINKAKGIVGDCGIAGSAIALFARSTGLGMESEVAIAYQEWENRKRLDAIDKALEQVEAALIEVMPDETNKA